MAAYRTQIGPREVVWGTPPAALRDMVAGYAGYRSFSPRPVVRRLFPRGFVVVLFDFESPQRWLRGGQQPLPGLAIPVLGLHDRVVRFAQAGKHSGVAVGLSPRAAFRLLDVEMTELANRRGDLADLLGRPALEVVERLAEAVDWPSRFTVLDRFLLGALRGLPGEDMADAAWQRLQRADGAISITTLADELCVSTRTLELRFRTRIGVSPKNAARILRFQHAVRLLDRDLPGGLSSIAHECGYTDHAHFAKEVRAMAGCTPTQLRATLRQR
ncbi:helix-turn-helix domain-containing protein [Amycolatopsis sp. NPDC059021]|uniref:helix-turn-helix domain-containing protein n=1 Tax=Amycolatopsis sp. NPDC059021 TaxID=3346704 RepID=UPI00366EBA02